MSSVTTLAPSLRTTDSETKYINAPKGDIAKVKGNKVGGLTVIGNEYPYDIAHKQNDMLVGNDNFFEFWSRLGALIQNGALDSYDQIIYNMPRKQSQPHVHHCHLMKFKDNRGEFKL